MLAATLDIGLWGHLAARMTSTGLAIDGCSVVADNLRQIMAFMQCNCANIQLYVQTGGKFQCLISDKWCRMCAPSDIATVSAAVFVERRPSV